jgi:hypothetical protein
MEKLSAKNCVRMRAKSEQPRSLNAKLLRGSAIQ